MPTLYLFPLPIANESLSDQISMNYVSHLKKVDFFICENLRTARRFISSLKAEISIEKLHFEQFDKNSDAKDVKRIFRFLNEHHIASAGLMSEAGLPAVADPGNKIVAEAHKQNWNVKPLCGPNSIVHALMCSGLNGQHFEFQGYLPIENKELKKQLSAVEAEILKTKKTCVFIETPYRSQKLFDNMIGHLSNELILCVAQDVFGKDESIKSMSIQEWKRSKKVLSKLPAVFLLGI